nr:MAG TPA: hypothetical protein [Caudoviricetes sp.]
MDLKTALKMMIITAICNGIGYVFGRRDRRRGK